MKRKKCNKCGKVKILSKFNKNKSSKDGYSYWCNKCVTEYSQENKEHSKEYNKEYFQSEEGKKAIKRYQQKIQPRITNNLRSRINQVLKGINKSASTMKLLGCTIEKFLTYIESQFQSGMTFDNYGLWEIDHIKPCSKFDLTDLKQQRKCFHYTNLQPLWQKDNLSKSNKYKEK